MINILGIETSCDETSVAIVNSMKQIITHKIYSQIDQHKLFSGVVPEIASRAHLEKLSPMIKEAMLEAKMNFKDLDAIAVTAGPGLIGGVIVGLMMAKALCSAIKKPLIAVNHLEAHALTIRLCGEIEFPYLLVLASGGHCQILIVEGVSKYQLLGKTIDDAAGEAFDKVAKMLKIESPSGAKIEKLALTGDHKRFKFPRPLINEDSCNFSFSGLKTAVKREIDSINIPISKEDMSDIAASFQEAVASIIENKVQKAIDIFKKKYPDFKNLVISGGVGANQYIRKRLKLLADENNMVFNVPDIKLCTDNAAMVAWAGIERYKLFMFDNLDIEPKARWPL